MTAAFDREPDHTARITTDLLPSDLLSDPKILRGIVGELLYGHCPDGFAITESRLVAIVAGCGHAWEASEKQGAFRVKIVNGS